MSILSLCLAEFRLPPLYLPEFTVDSHDTEEAEVELPG